MIDNIKNSIINVVDGKENLKIIIESGEISEKLFEKLFIILQSEMPYGVQKARTEDPYDWIYNYLIKLNKDI